MVKKNAALKVDILVPKRDLWLEEQMAGRRRSLLRLEPPGEAFVASAEDTVLHKLKWYEEGGRVSDRQWRDVLGVLKAQGGRLAMQELKEPARRLGLEALLNQALGQASSAELRGWPPPEGSR